MPKTTLTIATRQSPLALWQANFVKNQLLKYHPQLQIKLLGLTTTADTLLDISLNKIGGKGLFVKELEEALFNRQADIAVHSMKDVPMELPTGLIIPAICERADVRDVFVSPTYPKIAALPQSARVGTSSLRRQTQAQLIRDDLRFENLRGNIQTRLNKLDAGQFEAIILAAAGLDRLNLTHRIADYFSPQVMLPAAGQGALGVECREEDQETQALIAVLNHAHTHLAITAEREVCRLLGGGCSVPIAAFAEVQDQALYLRAMVANPSGSKILRAEAEDSLNQARFLGSQVAQLLLDQGAALLLSEFNNDN